MGVGLFRSRVSGTTSPWAEDYNIEVEGYRAWAEGGTSYSTCGWKTTSFREESYSI